MIEEINKIFEQWKQFLSWCYENNDKTIEIHRDNLERVMAYTRQLENIIKEIREYIEEKEKDDDNWVDYELLIEPIKIKEILDKENK